LSILESLFLISVFFVFHAYAGYPLTLYMIGLVKKHEDRRADIQPSTTLIITAYNEEKRIRTKIENTLSLTYPRDKLQILVASDGSTDMTTQIAAQFRAEGIETLSFAERRGKEHAQREAIRHARGEIIVFTDVATLLEPAGIDRIVANFADSSVGCVSSEDRLIGKDGKPSGEGAYVRYEMWLRRMESRVNTLVGLSGSFFAARKVACRDFSGEMQSDFRTLLTSVKMGLRGVSDPCVVGSYQDLSDRAREFERKVRTVLRGLTVYFRHIELLNVFRYGLFSYQYLCHKLLRWLVPLFLVIAFCSNLFLTADSRVFRWILLAQILFYGTAAWGWRRADESRVPNVLKIPAYFVAVNASIAVAWWRYFRRQRIVMWTPSER
jgi:glycosyltransferase involved in cell wall biosynthesis